jgi:hypothetical protein
MGARQAQVTEVSKVTSAGAPSWRLLWSEPGRAAVELATLLVSGPFLRRAARGDGHTVLMLPGFLADDRSTTVLRRYIEFIGYNAFGWARSQHWPCLAHPGGYGSAA